LILFTLVIRLIENARCRPNSAILLAKQQLLCLKIETEKCLKIEPRHYFYATDDNYFAGLSAMFLPLGLSVARKWMLDQRIDRGAIHPAEILLPLSRRARSER
jgi:hypothetical protein